MAPHKQGILQLTVCANKYDVPTQKALRLVPFKATVIAGNVEATITESIATTTEMRHSVKTVTLNLNGFLASTASDSESRSGVSSAEDASATVVFSF